MGAMLYIVSRRPRSAPSNAPTPEQIRAFREAEAISQQALANLLDVSIGAVRKWESRSPHGRIPRGLHLERLQDLLDDGPAARKPLEIPSARQIKAFQQALDLSVPEFAEYLGVSAGAVRKWLEETRVPRGIYLDRLLARMQTHEQGSRLGRLEDMVRQLMDGSEASPTLRQPRRQTA